MSRTARKTAIETLESAVAGSVCLGPVMPIGGAEAKDGNGEIVSCFLELAGGKRARILVIPTASEDAAVTGRRYSTIFSKNGAKSVDVLQVEKRSDANEDASFDQVKAATGIYITGGDQARLVALLAGTRVMECLRTRNAAGVIVAGTSAGASIMADHLLVGATDLPVDSNDSSARRSLVELSSGFGLLRDMVIDQHFSARGRMGRLLSAFAGTPGLLGLGLDEATAVLVQPSGQLEVLGAGMVAILDGREAVSDFNERRPGEILSIFDLSLHVLGPGRRFDVHARRPLPLEETEYAGPSSEQITLAKAQAASASL
jgi:cyanophycinase